MIPCYYYLYSTRDAIERPAWDAWGRIRVCGAQGGLYRRLAVEGARLDCGPCLKAVLQGLMVEIVIAAIMMGSSIEGNYMSSIALVVITQLS